MVRDRGTERKVQELVLAAATAPLNPKGQGQERLPERGRESHTDKATRKGFIEGNNDLSWDTASPPGRNQGNKYSELTFLTASDLPMSTLAAPYLKPEVTDAH